MKTTIATEAERAALEEWYGERASQMEALFEAGGEDAHEEIAELRRPTWPEYAAGKRAAHAAAQAIMGRSAVTGGAR